jgi:hypothetical protein
MLLLLVDSWSCLDIQGTDVTGKRCFYHVPRHHLPGDHQPVTARRITAPMKATNRLCRLNPVTPEPPKRLAMNPPQQGAEDTNYNVGHAAHPPVAPDDDAGQPAGDGT